MKTEDFPAGQRDLGMIGDFIECRLDVGVGGDNFGLPRCRNFARDHCGFAEGRNEHRQLDERSVRKFGFVYMGTVISNG